MASRDIYYIEVVGKALDVLEVFARLPKRQLSLQEISQQLRLNKNAVFRILYTLAEHGYIVKENQRYELGSKLIDLSNAKLRYTDLLSVATPLLDALRNRFGETVNLGVLDSDQIRYIGVWESRDRFRLAERVGACDMLHCTALGKAFLSCLPFEEVRQLLRKRGLPALTEYTITSLQALKAELETIRKRGYAVDKEESVLGACCVGAAVLNADETRPIATISASGPMTRMNEERVTQVGQALREITSKIRAKLGTQPSAVTRTTENQKASTAKS